MSAKRDQIVATTCQLMELQGYHATGLNQILTESETPKGSLYYYFPGGKEELFEVAISRATRTVEERLRAGMAAHDHPAEALREFILTLADYVERSGFESGGPITAVALEAASTNDRLNTACRDAFDAWQGVICDKLRSVGYDATRAERLAALSIAAIEGATILSRTRRDIAPLQAAAEELALLLNCNPVS